MIFGEGRGFGIGPDKPKLFTIGRRLDVMGELDTIDYPTSFTFYLYELDIGSTYCYPDKVSLKELSGITLPPGFDSVYLKLKDRKHDEINEKNVFYRDYLIYNSS